MLRLNTNNLLRSKFAGLSSISLLIICLLLLSVPAAGQTTGRVQGTVTDQQNAVMADATVELLHPATNTTKTTKTTDAGSYGFDYLQPGEYVVKVGIQGFKTASVANVLVEATRTATVNVTLEIGAASETVDVKAGGQRVDTVNAQIATTVEQRFLRDLPSFNRNVLSYAEMQPGVSVNTSGVAGGSQMLDSPGTSANVNGNRSMRNNFYLDGVESANWRNSALQMPNPDAVQEVQVSTSNTAAEYGRQVGGVFNVIPKSGTNQFRGTAFYFFRLKDLNARPWGTPANSKKLAQNQKLFGGNLGGPVFKDKTFFFFSYDGFRDRTARVLNKVNYPTAAMAKGDFSALLAGPNPRIINNPATGQPFPGNIIPAAAQDPVGKSLFNLMQPTVPNFGDLYVWTFEEPARNQTFLAKGDHHWTSAHTTSFTWMRSNGSQTLPAAPNLATTFSAWGPEINLSHQNLYQGRHNWVINPNLIADFHMGFVGHVSDRNNSNFKNAFPDAKGDVMTTLGARNVTDVQEGIKQYLPYLILAGVGIAHHGWIGLVDQPTFQFGGKVSWIKSSHTVKFGADAVDKGQRLAVDGSLPATNQLDFDGRFSSNGTTTNVAAYTYADLLLGRATFFQSQGILDYTLKSRDIFFFLQDEWKITPRLTLSPGLRYELYLPPRVNGDQRTGYFTPNPVQGAISTHRSTRFPNAPAGLAFEGDRGVPSGFFENQRNLIAPRFGVAWDVFGDSRTALRAGVGKYYG
ncbi:MAG: carboxypeptidase regulatory-like domain-containing protein, partial [Blastocatellia bacterium]